MGSIVITGAKGRIAAAISSTIEQKCGEIISVSRASGEGHLSHEDAFNGDVFKRASVILHCAWSSVPATSESHPGIEWQNDLPLLVRILNTLKDGGEHKPLFIFLSSAGTVYGNSPGRANIEVDISRPIGWYGRGKVAAETLCDHFAKDFGIPLLILRISNPYGFAIRPNRPQGIISVALEAAKSGNTLRIWGDGSAKKDFLHCKDLADALALAINRRITGVFNLGYGFSHQVNDVLKIVERMTGKTLDVNFTPAPTWDVSDSRVNCDAFRAATEWRPSIDLEKGVHLCVETQIDP